MGVRKFELLKDFFEYPAGYIVNVENGVGKIGSIDGYEIPLKIIESHQDWFKERLDNYK